MDQRADSAGPPTPGDVRLSAMFIGVRPDHIVGGGGLGLGLIGHVDLPSGDPGRFLGQDGVAGGGSIAVTYEFTGATLSADVGTQFNPTLDLANLNGTDTLQASFAIGALASDSVGLTAEFVAQPPFEPPDRLIFPAEVLGSLRYKDQSNGSYWTFGGALGMTSGPGVAAFRVFVGGGIAKQEPPRQPDFDVIGQFQVRDLCPLEDETMNSWKDDDGCPDTLSALAVDVRWRGLPVEAEVTITGPDGTQASHIGPAGMQLDAVPGSEWTVDASQGMCLSGSAGATVIEGGTAIRVDLFQRLDARVVVEVLGPNNDPLPTATVQWQGEEACVPTDIIAVSVDGLIEHDLGVGEHQLMVTADGYSVHEELVEFVEGDAKHIVVHLARTLIRVEKQQIVILEKVHFETAKAVIKPESFPLLNEVAAVIITNPDLGRVEVAGHTDSRGSDTYNLGLSDERAASVRTYLIGQGVTAEQLLAVGYGEARPLDTNKTSTGREKNRRVEFNLIDADDTEETGDGSEASDPAGGTTPVGGAE
jgi:outer membrane protein OmpA-like peptidoglycan-associated protein